MNKQNNFKQKNQLLTLKQSQFAKLVAEEGISNTQAYRIAYKPNKNATNKSIHEMSCRVFANVKVQSRIRDIQHEIVKDQRMRTIRREEYVLQRLTEEAEFADNANSRIRALELLGKTVSLFNDKTETNIKMPRSSEEIKEDLKLKLQKLLSG